MEVFISYARADGRQLADHLFADLEKCGNKPWLDRSDIDAGSDWSKEIETAIDRCDFLLALLTLASFHSEVCWGEQRRALRCEKRVIPLLARAGADRPVYLETKHFIDFTDAASYEQRFAELQQALLARGGCALAELDKSLQQMVLKDDAALAAAQPGAASTWDEIRSRSATQSERFLRELRSTDKHPSTYVAECYVQREAAARELRAFLEAEEQALIVIGDAGVGKSTLLCHWSLELADGGNAVFFYECGAALPPKIDHEIARDLGFDNADRLGEGLDHVDAVAKQAGRKAVLVFDGINDFGARDGTDAADLLRAINDVVGRLKGKNVKIVLSCGSPTWARLRRDLRLALFSTRYYTTAQGEQAVVLRPFDDTEAATAYERYRSFFDLRSDWNALLPDLQARLHEPLIMRLLAETHAHRPGLIEAPNLTFGVLSNYVTSHTTPRSLAFLDKLATLMSDARRPTLLVRDLSSHADLAAELNRDDDQSAYAQLLDAGILAESEGNLFTPAALRFTQARVGAFMIARHVAQAGAVDERTFADLVARAADLQLAWDAALILLPACSADSVFEALASSPSADLRELAAQGLRELHADDAGRADALLARLVASASDAARRTALKAAYNIGPGARALFMRAALSDSEPLQQALRDVLYLIWRTASHVEREEAASTLYLLWRHDPEFTYGLLRELVQQIGLRDVFRGWPLTRLFVDLTITIYINHCERQDVITATDELYNAFATQRLPFRRVLLKDRGPLARGFVGAVGASFARPVLEWMGVDGAFFELPSSERERLTAAAGWLAPAESLDAHADALCDLLKSDRVIFRGAATLVVATHAYRDFGAAEPVLRRVAADVDGRGRLWLLLAFAVLLPDTPEQWGKLVDELTAQVIDAGALSAAAADDVYAGLLLLPSGLAAGKRGDSMPLVEARLRAALERGDVDTASRFIRCLGAVAFYFPKTVCRVLAAAIDRRDDTRLDDALVYCFARMRALYLDAADHYMDELGIRETLQRRVAAEADVQLVHKYVLTVGFFNNAVHFSANYPKMRRAFSAGALELLATVRSPQEFIAEYGFRAVKMFNDANFRLVEWTRADDAAA